ncbi:type II CRISPR RNA-guided endonuclease Cas9 [Agriterribacter sp.]|uniref:type II CRISPR RNA-guided endonuclease Cas9 n=1 Tax=Agriterribacter sp. TaxID=2821509 RepID=UPI002BE8FE16|nr:type II CRISPR RNA-guided endonuclease Cas9 [Agriterribacter sp.]HTN06288.1 HNH endonuclease domain-containing protein [Agriterribacter sp.]
MKKILGLDIGTNSIGAALINLPEWFEDYGKEGNIEWLGSRIIPTDGDYLKKFEEGNTAGTETKAATRRSKRGARRLKHRYKLRRTRLIKLFKALGWLIADFPLDDSKTFKKSIRENNNLNFSISDYLPFSENTILEFEKELGIEGKKSKKKGNRKGGKSIAPEDWITYYLRKKALTQRIEIPELVRIIYMMNQRRGFKSSRKDLKDTVVLTYEEFKAKKERNEYGESGIETQFVSITKIKSVTFKEEKEVKNGNKINAYTIIAEDPRIESWEENRKKQPEWEGKEATFLVVQKIDKNGKFSQNKPQIPKEDNWALCTTALDEKINEQVYPGKYFFDELQKAFKENKDFKIRQYPVYRWRYKKELEEIWKKQCELNPELRKINSDTTLLIRLTEVLYPTQAKLNMSKLSEFKSHDLIHIISNDIIYYQRELRSQKNSISECRYEKRKGIDGEMYGLKCIPRSSPLFQEFRIWQDIHNIRILEREVKVDGKTRLDVDVTGNLIDEQVKEKLFELFNSKAAIKEKNILELIKENNPDNNIKFDIVKKDKIHSHRINLYANRDELKGNEILNRYRPLFKKVEFNGEDLLADEDKLQKLWHIDYSITSSDEERSKKGITTALNNLLEDKPGKDRLIELFCKLPELKKEYGSYSAMAIKKILPVMRCGKCWKEEDILKSVKDRASQILERLSDINHNIRRLSEIADDDVQKQVLKSFIGMEDLTKALGTYQAGYLIYDRHSENIKTSIHSVEEFGRYIQKEIPNNSLRNPIVEKVVREAMYLVRDIWKKYGVINEIHIEIGRDLKNNSEQRKKIADIQKNNFDEKQRIKQLLYELLNEEFEQYVDAEDSKPFDWKTKIESGKKFEVNPNPESPVDIDKFRIWRSLSKYTDSDWDKKVKDEKIPTENLVKKYALWLSQNCRSPYTGKIIPLSKLFDTAQYEIEHIIPRRKLKNDSFNNLVIAEWGVNKAKNNQLAANFIASSNGKCTYGGSEYKLFTYDEYDAYCKETFRFQKSKRKNLLATEVPEDFVQRQLNDTRYIGRKLSELLSPIAKNKNGSLNENGILFTIGSITSELKNNWGLNAVWKDIVRPRFERLETITGKQFIIPDENDANKYHFDLRENPKLEIKRIDHRHHALDALIIAATSREHIRYLNTLNAANTDEEFKKLRLTLVKGKIREFKEPWSNFTKDTKDKLEETIVSFITSNNIITKPQNEYIHGYTEKGKPIKFEQKENARWMAIRRSMFKEPLGVKWLKETKEVSVFDAFKIEIERQLINKEKGKTASYIYDKHARQAIKQIIYQLGINLNEKDYLLSEIEKHLKKVAKPVSTGKTNRNGTPVNKTIYTLGGIDYEKISVAHFARYKTKRMDLSKKEYVEKLTIEKMKSDFPYFSEDEKRNNAFNNLFLRHIKEYKNDPKEAFGAEGIDKLNEKAMADPKIRKPVKSVTRLDGTVEEEDMFNGGFYETDKGANTYFIMYEDQQTKEREGFLSISTHKAIERLNDITKKGIADEKKVMI